MADGVQVEKRRLDASENDALIGMARMGADAFGYTATLRITDAKGATDTDTVSFDWNPPSNSGFQSGSFCLPLSKAMPMVGTCEVPMPAIIFAMLISPLVLCAMPGIPQRCRRASAHPCGTDRGPHCSPI